ncbi:hypothetical protein [Halorubrum vacuolatum]|uniref:Uncharacterized protein n=1 Tax=Halorubrum vacuolatum TaxID=63740 RepID=A0A238Y628_HALVU|nr:hypothetical protein [Halorubrum vacuolatum]SNR66470.1 hypothetical protein SAMN06264855_13111 [Halorubrum vacuolatum]
MTAHPTIDRFIEYGLFERADDDRLGVTQSFIDVVKGHRDGLDAAEADDVETAVATVTADGETAVRLCERVSYDPDVLSRVIAVREVDPSATLGEALLLAVITDQLETGFPRNEGAPEGFIPGLRCGFENACVGV